VAAANSVDAAAKSLSAAAAALVSAASAVSIYSPVLLAIADASSAAVTEARLACKDVKEA
jgi:hypothetical protein